MPTEYTTIVKVVGLEPQERWSKEEYAIRQVIGSSVPTAAFAGIKSEKTVKGAWPTLKKIYKEKTRGLAADLMRRFRKTRCGQSESIRTHFEHMANVGEQLAAMGKNISDDASTDILLTSLLSSYS